MKFQLLFSIFLLSLLSSSYGQSTSILNRIFNPFNWFTARSNSSAVEIKHDEEVPITRTQILPLTPPPLPIRMQPLSDKFDDPPKMGSLDNMHIPLRMVPPPMISPKVLTPMVSPMISSIAPVPMIPPKVAPPLMFRKRIGELVARPESRMEEETMTENVETTTLSSTELSTSANQVEMTVTSSGQKMDTEVDATTTATNKETSTSTSSQSPDVTTEPFVVEATETTIKPSESEESKDSIATTEDSVPEPVFILEEVKPEVKLVPAPRGEFLYESDFAKYLNQFYYSKPTVFDNLQMSKRHTPIFDTMKI